jgi:uncharacterized protein (DUF1330 family)
MVYTVTSLFDVTDYDAYVVYGTASRAITEKHSGKFIVATHGNFKITPVEGKIPDIVNIAVFPNMEKCLAFWNSPEYLELKKDRQRFCTAEIVILERNK